MSKSGSTKLFGGTEKALQPWGRLLPCAWFQSRVSADVDNVSYGPLGPEESDHRSVAPESLC